MDQKRILLGLGLMAIVAILIVAGISILQGTPGGGPVAQSNGQPSGTIAVINGEPISKDELEVEYQALLSAYRPVYEENGNDIDEFLNGSDAGYNKLKLQYQALERLFTKKVAESKLDNANLVPTEDEVNAQYEEAYANFLSQLDSPETQGMNLEQELEAIFEDSEKLAIAQDLLGFSDNSLDALKSRLRLQSESNLRTENLWRIAFGNQNDFDPTDEEDFNRLRDWVDSEVAASDVEYFDPLLEAHATEVNVSRIESLDERSDLLATAISKFEDINQSSTVDKSVMGTEVNITRVLNRLYDLKVNWDLQLERELVQQAQDSIDAQRELEEVQEQIALNRQKASQSISAEDSQNEDLLRAKVQTDNNNPLYYYLLAKLLMENWEENGTREIRNLLFAALSRDDEFVDAYVLQGDLNMIETKYIMAIEDYQKAFDLYDTVSADPESAIKVQDNDKDAIQRKLAESYVGRAEQLGEMNEPPADAAEQKAHALNTARNLLQPLLDALPENDPDLPFALDAMGDLEVLSENFEIARDYYVRTLELLESEEVMVKLGNVHLELNELGEARGVFESALEINPYNARAHLGLAKVFRGEGNIAQALVKYEDAFKYAVNLDYIDRYAIASEALELDPQNISMRLQFADFLGNGNVFTAALREYDTIVDQDDSVMPAFIGMSKVHLARLQYDKAVNALRNAEALSGTVREDIEIYELLRQAERGLAGPGKPMLDSGQEVLYRLAILYLQDDRLVDSFNMLGELSGRYPDFRSDEVSELRRQLTQTAGDSLPGSPVANLGNQAIAPGEDHPQYNSMPPTSGWHYAVPAAWGVHSDPIQHEIQVRNLAIGGILLQYNPDKIAQSDLDQLTTLVRSMRTSSETYCQVLMAPYEQTESSIVITAWNRIDELEEFDRGRIISFIDTFINRAPNAGEVLCSLNSAGS